MGWPAETVYCLQDRPYSDLLIFREPYIPRFRSVLGRSTTRDAGTHVASNVATRGRFMREAEAGPRLLSCYSYSYMRLIWLLAALVLAAALAFLQYWALADFLYWKYPWFDTMMHFIGGLAIGTFAAAFLGIRRSRVFLLGMVAVAVGWELFELVIHAEREANFVFDTSLDLLMDTVGMTIAYALARYTLWRSA